MTKQSSVRKAALSEQWLTDAQSRVQKPLFVDTEAYLYAVFCGFAGLLISVLCGVCNCDAEVDLVKVIGIDAVYERIAICSTATYWARLIKRDLSGATCCMWVRLTRGGRGLVVCT
jgi:hypothetical protein